MSLHNPVHSHTYQHFENLQLSAQEFYQSLEAVVQSYDYPNVKCRIRPYHERGILSTKRDYLCIWREELEYNVCAAPFGKSFFISWWFKEKDDSLREFLERIPIIGRLFKEPSKSYYEVDTELMFSKSIEAILTTAVKRILAEKGFTLENMQLVD